MVSDVVREGITFDAIFRADPSDDVAFEQGTREREETSLVKIWGMNFLRTLALCGLP